MSLNRHVVPASTSAQPNFSCKLCRSARGMSRYRCALNRCFARKSAPKLLSYPLERSHHAFKELKPERVECVLVKCKQDKQLR